MWPIRLVVVVFPLEPVIPMVRPFRKGAASSTSPITGTPRAARRFERRQIGRNVGRKHDQVAAFEDLGRLLRERDVQSSRTPGQLVQRLQIGGADHARPRARSNAAEATPDFFMPDHQRLYALELHLSFSVVSANSASTRPAIQKRAMIFDSVQPSASK